MKPTGETMDDGEVSDIQPSDASTAKITEQWQSEAAALVEGCTNQAQLDFLSHEIDEKRKSLDGGAPETTGDNENVEFSDAEMPA